MLIIVFFVIGTTFEVNVDDTINSTNITMGNISSSSSISFKVPGKYLNSPTNAQQGEDVVIQVILDFLFNTRTDIRYLDIGCNHPYKQSNTYLFFKKNGSGVLVDANPLFKEAVEKIRPRDVFVWAGVVPRLGSEKELKFYHFVHNNGLSTFSLERARETQRRIGKKKGEIQIITVPIIQINDIFKQHFSGKKIDLLSVDVEGLDEELLRAIDYEKYRPKIIIVESLKVELKYGLSDFVNFMETKDYILVADTFINYIFADKSRIKIKPKRWYTDHVTYNGRKIQESKYKHNQQLP